jgi:hypothetical protein
MTQPRFIAEYAELSRIDFLLDQLARAVERGEVPRQSYDLMAPRYLTRREELVATVTGAHRVSAPPDGSQVRGAVPAAYPPAAQAGPESRTRVGRVARPEPKPVRWTTVLTFLGAFLVVVASAIFAIAIWDVIGVGGKLALMGLLTALFYVGGWYARRIELLAGGTALTAVGSAMLLFEGWIAIDGLNLEGPIPWAIVLLICSAAYWYTEVRLAQRFFGVVGAAAQAGWWWLLGEGLGLPSPVRLAGLAVVALAWQLASERGREDRTVGSLARVLEWIAPVAVTLLSVGVLFDLALLRNADMTEVLCAGVVAAIAGLVVWRSRLLPRLVGRVAAAVAQLPLFVSIMLAGETAGHSWWLVAALVVMALAYDSAALFSAGAVFAVPGLVAEAGVVREVCAVLGASDRVTVLAFVALAVVWGLSARIAKREDIAQSAPGAPAAAVVAEFAAFGLMVVTSLGALSVSDGIALAGPALSAADAYVALGVLVGWYALSALSRFGVVPFAGALWSLYTLAALMSWLLPDQRPEAYGAGLVALAGVWIASAAPLSGRYGTEWQVATRWAGRIAVALIVAGGVLLGFEMGNQGTLWPATLMALAAGVFLVDAIMLRSRITAAAATAAAVFAAAYAGGFVSFRLGAVSDAAWFALSAAAAGALVTAALAVVGRRSRTFLWPAAVTAALVPFPLLAGVMEYSGHRAAAFALLALAWAGAAVVATQWLALPAGLSVVLSVVSLLAHIGGPPWVTTLALSTLGFALGSAVFTREGGPGGRFASAAVGLALSGLGGHALLVALAATGELLGNAGEWYALGEYGMTMALAVLGAHAIAQSARHRFEPGYYVGGIALVASVWSLWGALGVDWFELYTTPLALYLIGAGYLHRYLSPARELPVVTDAGAAVVGLGLPLIVALSAPGSEALGHAGWVIGLSLAAIGGGVAAKSRWYFFGGVGAITVVSLYRSFVALSEVWWLLLGFVGVAMLVIALTWERQRMLVADTRERLRRSFEGWR